MSEDEHQDKQTEGKRWARTTQRAGIGATPVGASATMMAAPPHAKRAQVTPKGATATATAAAATTVAVGSGAQGG